MALITRSRLSQSRHRLRDYPEDISDLVSDLVCHFTPIYAAKMNRTPDKIPLETMRALVSWPWQGNTRELENSIGRSVILSPDPPLRAPFAELRADQGQVPIGSLFKKSRGITSFTSDNPEGHDEEAEISRSDLADTRRYVAIGPVTP